MLQTQQSIRAQMLIVEVKGELQALSAQQWYGYVGLRTASLLTRFTLIYVPL